MVLSVSRVSVFGDGGVSQGEPAHEDLDVAQPGSDRSVEFTGSIS